MCSRRKEGPALADAERPRTIEVESLRVRVAASEILKKSRGSALGRPDQEYVQVEEKDQPLRIDLGIVCREGRSCASGL